MSLLNKCRPQGWHGDVGHRGFDPDIASVEARFGARSTPISEFQGKYRFLSNFYQAPLTHDGIWYPTSEHAFQAAKTLDFAQRWELSQLGTPSEAKHRGRRVTLRPDWEQVKDHIMTEVVLLKFIHHRSLRQQLLATGEAQLIEGNTWGDTYWGVCRGEGKNMLGTILMLVRDQLRGS